jgi:hypothetical protein
MSTALSLLSTIFAAAETVRRRQDQRQRQIRQAREFLADCDRFLAKLDEERNQEDGEQWKE